MEPPCISPPALHPIPQSRCRGHVRLVQSFPNYPLHSAAGTVGCAAFVVEV